MQKEEVCEVHKGGLVEGLWKSGGKGVAKMTQESVDEDCLEVVGGEVGFIIPRKDVGDLGSNVV